MRITRITLKIFLVSLLGFLSIGSSVKNKICFTLSNQYICYFQPQEALLTWKQWDAARNICQKNNATLPIIENQEVQNTFEEYLRHISLNNNRVWLGGRQEVTKKEWQWSNNKSFYQPDLILYGDENPKTQAFISRISGSVSPSNATVGYQAVNPSWTCYYICQYSDSQCPTDDSIQNEHHGCLKVFNQWLKLREATKNCNNSGGQLAIFDGDEFLTKAPEVYKQMELYQSSSSVCYYIGLHRIDTWFWMRSNNENSTMEGNYDNWRDRNNRAHGDCLFATANDHRWEASGCNYEKRFICQTTSTTTDSTSRKSTTAGNSQTTTVTIADTINSHNGDSSRTVLAATGAGVLIVSLCIIVILVVILRKSKSSNNKTEQAEMDSKNTNDSKDKKTEGNKLSKTTEEQSIYADIPLAEKNANDTVEGGQKGIVYASLDFNQGVTYAEPSTLYANTQNVTGPIYAEALNATGNGSTSTGSSPAVKIGPMGDVYTLPMTNITPSSAKTTERPIYANT